MMFSFCSVPSLRNSRLIVLHGTLHSPQTYGEFVAYVRLCNQAVTGVRASSQHALDKAHGSVMVGRIVEMLQRIGSWVDDIPPIDEPARFGNKAFR